MRPAYSLFLNIWLVLLYLYQCDDNLESLALRGSFLLAHPACTSNFPAQPDQDSVFQELSGGLLGLWSEAERAFLDLENCLGHLPNKYNVHSFSLLI